MRTSAAVVAVFVALAGCARTPASQPEASANENIVITASPEAIRALESDMRKELANRRDAPAQISLNETSGPRPRTVDASPNILNAAFLDARRKATVLAASVHAKLGDPIAVDEVNAADPFPRSGGPNIGLKGNSALSRVSVMADGPEIVRVTFALTSRAHAPATITVYGMQAVQPAAAIAAPTQLFIQVSASGGDPQQTLTTWENIVRSAARARGIRDADITVGNVNASVIRRPR